MPDPKNFVYLAECIRVVDGDTFIARVDLGFRVKIDINVRLRGVNAPEHNRPGGQDAKAYLGALLLPDQDMLTIQSYKDSQSFTRWICDAWVGDKSIAQLIIENGHGVAFDPRTDHWER